MSQFEEFEKRLEDIGKKLKDLTDEFRQFRIQNYNRIRDEIKAHNEAQKKREPSS